MANARTVANEMEQKLHSLVSDLRLTTDFEELYDAIRDIHDAIEEMESEAEQLWDESQED